MIFILIALFLFLGIAFFQTIQGTFSALIMLVLTFLSAAVAVNFYAPISHGFLLDRIYDYADSAALIVLFALTLVLLRVAADNFVRGNVVIWEWPDRIMAGLLSIPIALVLVGIGTQAFQMLPFDDQVMWFNHFSDNGKTEVRSGLFPCGDDFASWCLGLLSQGSLKNETAFELVHPDWPGEASAQRIAVQRETKHTVPPGAISLGREGAWKLKDNLVVRDFGKGQDRSSQTPQVTTTLREPRDERHYYLAARVEMTPAAADGDGNYRIGWGQIRLVGFTDPGRARTMNVYAIGVRDPSQGPKYNYLRLKVPYNAGTDSYDQQVWETRNYGVVTQSNKLDVVFEVSNEFVPWFLEYKRWARVLVPKVAENDPTAGEVNNAPPVEEKRSVGEVATPGVHNQFQIEPGRTAFTNELPFKLYSDTARGGETEISGNKLGHGHVSGKIGVAGGLDSGAGTVINEFEVSEGKRLLRVECNFVPAGDQLVQNVFGMVGNVVQQKAYDKKGNVYLPIGKYLILNLGGAEQQAELIYHGTGMEGEVASGRDQFQTVTRSQLQTYGGKVGFLYAIPPGTEMDRFEPGRPFESQTLQLRAPN